MPHLIGALTRALTHAAAALSHFRVGRRHKELKAASSGFGVGDKQGLV